MEIFFLLILATVSLIAVAWIARRAKRTGERTRRWPKSTAGWSDARLIRPALRRPERWPISLASCSRWSFPRERTRQALWYGWMIMPFT